MPQAIPAAIGLGSSALGASSGKKASKKQSKQAEAQLKQIQPLIDSIIQASQATTAAGQSQFDTSQPIFTEGATGLRRATYDLSNFYRPLASGNTSAINAFLSPERRAINQGYSNIQDNIARFAPRGGGRVAAGIKADVGRQGQLSDLVFNARRAGAQGLSQVGQQFGQLAGLGLQGTGQGLSGLSSGASGAGSIFSQLSNSQNNALGQNALAGMSTSQLGKELGGLLASVLKGGGKKATTLPSAGSLSTPTFAGGGSTPAIPDFKSIFGGGESSTGVDPFGGKLFPF